MIEALPKAKELWNSPNELIELWDNLQSKLRHEQLVSFNVGKVNTIADLGCGAGRYAEVIDAEEYTGYDGSLPMIAKAKELHPGKQFLVVDIFNFQSYVVYDTVIMIDVAHHQNEPVKSILRILELWKADRYIISLLVGDIRENLYNSTVVSFVELLELYDKYAIIDTHIESFDDNEFAWVLLEIVNESS